MGAAYRLGCFGCGLWSNSGTCQVKFPYDLGFYRNVCAVLGPRFFLWCWPGEVAGNGLTFETGSSVGKLPDHYWDDAVGKKQEAEEV